MPSFTAARRLQALLMAGGLSAIAAFSHAAPGEQADIVIRGGTIYDGGVGMPFVGDVAMRGDHESEQGH
jgi:N-acyl-D-amino-acid deacylase